MDYLTVFCTLYYNLPYCILYFILWTTLLYSVLYNNILYSLLDNNVLYAIVYYRLLYCTLHYRLSSWNVFCTIVYSSFNPLPLFQLPGEKMFFSRWSLLSDWSPCVAHWVINRPGSAGLFYGRFCDLLNDWLS